MTCKNNVHYLCVSTEVFQGFSLKDNPQGIATVVSQLWEVLEQVRLSPEDCWVALEAVQDPGNLGTILRTCDATGCRGVFLLFSSHGFVAFLHKWCQTEHSVG